MIEEEENTKEIHKTLNLILVAIEEEENTKKIHKTLKLILVAIHNLQDERGSTEEEILDHISSEHKMASDEIESHVQAAFEKGMNLGMLKQERTRYLIEKSISLDKIRCDASRRMKGKKKKRWNRRRSHSRM